MNRSLQSSCAWVVMMVIASLAGIGVASAQTPPWTPLPNGSPDQRFGDDGIAVTLAAGSSVLQSDGKIVTVVGQGLARYNVDGSLDPSFGTDGVAISSCAGGALTLQPDGRLLAFTASKQVVRCHGDGSIDAGFGSGGVVNPPWAASSFVLGSDGRIVVGGDTAVGWALARYLPNGNPDPSFGSGGSVGLTIPASSKSTRAVAIQVDGRILLAGDGIRPTSNRQDFILVRVDENGTVDSGFGTNGIVYTDFGGRIDRVSSVLPLPDGQIVVGGSFGSNTSGNWDMGLASYFSDGALNRSVRIPPYNTGRIGRLQLHVDGKVVAVGTAQNYNYPYGSDIALVQYNSDLTPDNSFGIGGTVLIDNGGRNDGAADLLVQPDGQIVVAGTSASSPLLCPSCSTFTFLARYRYDSARGPFGGGRRSIPGRIEAEDYDLGGQGTGYTDTTGGNQGGAFVYRTDDVDIKVSREGGHAIGWLVAGESLAYTIDVQADGHYNIGVRVGSMLPGRTFTLEVDGREVSHAIAVPQSADWDIYGTVRVPRVHLAAGRQVLRVVMGPLDSIDLQSIEITAAGPGGFKRDGDFDGDGKADLAVFRPVGGSWYVRDTTAAGYNSFQWGAPGDVPVLGDFDGDGRSDITIWRPSNGTWYIRDSSLGYSIANARVFQWGRVGDVPIAADFDEDGKTDITIWRPSNGTWYVRDSSLGYSTANARAFQWGIAGDLPSASDFDGDGRPELTVFRPSSGSWFVSYSSLGYSNTDYAYYQWGLPGDVPLTGDFDGDGKTEVAVFRQSTGDWFIRYSSMNYAATSYGYYRWGGAGDQPLSADFDGDGRSDISVYRPATGQWFIRYSSLDYDPANCGAYQWGLPGDTTVQ